MKARIASALTFGQFRHLFAQISNLNFPYEPSDVWRHLYLCGFGRGKDGSEAHTQWVRNKISLFSSLSI